MFMDFEDVEEFAAKLYILLDILPDELRHKIELRYNRYKLKEEVKNEKKIKKKEIPNFYS